MSIIINPFGKGTGLKNYLTIFYTWYNISTAFVRNHNLNGVNADKTVYFGISRVGILVFILEFMNFFPEF